MPIRYPDSDELKRFYQKYHGEVNDQGWRVRLRAKFSYFKPVVSYQAIVERLVKSKTQWIDIGGGKTIFQHNDELSRELSSRANFLVGVDPSGTLEQNPFVHEKAITLLENYKTDKVFDLATLRMVAEHVENPDIFVRSLAKLIAGSGYIVILTPNKWAIASVFASILPHKFHVLFARRLSEDVFPTCYRMNTKRELHRIFDDNGFDEVGFAYLADCVIGQRYHSIYSCELLLWKILSFFRIRYPENNILAVYQRRGD